MNSISTKGFTRRSLMKSAGATLAAPLLMQSSARGAAATLPASERVNLGFIGVGMMGRGHLRRLVDERAAQITAVCDVDQWRLTDAQSQVDRAYAAGQKSGQYKGCAAYKDSKGLPVLRFLQSCGYDQKEASRDPSAREQARSDRESVRTLRGCSS